MHQRLHGGPWRGTAGIAFVADDLAAWLVGLLADRGRKKLTTLVLGTEQERALRSAATAAVEDVGRELRPGNVEQAEHVALVISQVFNEPVPTAPLAGHQTMLEALQTGIAGQLRVLDDASLTSQRQSSAELLGVPATVLAEKLTTNLLREIVVRGSRGGPLESLAALPASPGDRKRSFPGFHGHCHRGLGMAESGPCP